MNTYDINKIKLPNGDICNLRETVTKTVQNTNIIHIEDAAEKPLKECKIDIQPVQDLHGYDNPWPAGGGVNILPPLRVSEVTRNGITFKSDGNGTYSLSGTASSSVSLAITLDEPTTYTAGTYYMSVLNNVFGGLVGFYGVQNSTNVWDIVINANNKTQQITFATDTTITALSVYIENGSTVNYTFSPVLSKTGFVQAFTPYSNICPITGWTGAKVTRTGKNLVDVSAEENGYISSTGIVTIDGTSAHSALIKVIPGATYTFSGTSSPIGSGNKRIHAYSKDGEWLSQITYATVSGNTPYSIQAQIPPGVEYVKLSYYKTDANKQLELGSTATTYEPYSGTTYSIEFPTEAGTVYGGSLDVTNGVLTVDRAMVDLGTLTWIDENDIVSGQFRCNFTDYKPNFGGNLICSILKGYPRRDWNAVQNGEITLSNSAVLPLLRVRDSLFINISATEIAEYLSGQILVYELATPVTYQLTSQEITTLLGTNNIWADTGNISCTYYVNSQLNTELNNYISKPLGATKGDMIYYPNNTTPSRLEIGNQGQVLKVNSDGVPHWNNENIAEYKTLTDQEIAIFDDGIQNSVLKSYSVKIEPKQDLHGYDKPWVSGAGKNLLPDFQQSGSSNGITWTVNANKTITLNGTATATVTIDAPDGTWTWDGNSACMLSGCPSGGDYSNGYSLRVDAANSVSEYSTPDTGSGVSFTGYTANISLTDKLLHYRIVVRNGCVCNNVTFKPQLELGTSVTTYGPYSNICPITGFNNTKVMRTGFNQWDEEWEVGYIDPVGSLMDMSGYIRSKNYITVFPGTSYYCKTNGHIMYVCQYDNNKRFIRNSRIGYTDNVITVRQDCHYIKFNMGGSYGGTYNNDLAVNYPSIATDYKTYQGQTCNITFPTEAGTVYGGTVTVNEDGSGTIIIDKGHIDLGNLTWNKIESGVSSSFPYRWMAQNINLNIGGSVNEINCLCSRYEGETYSPIITGGQKNGVISTESRGYIQFIDSSFDALTPEQVKTSLTGVDLVYKLATPLTYNLTTNQLTILLGTNHIWSDAGNITITYPVNLKGYIDSINNLTDNYVKYTDYATNDTCGVVKTNGAFGILTDNTGLLKLVQPTDTEIQTATGMYKVITPYSQHKAAFYGLARAAGDTTQASSTNTVGNYTQDAKASIQDMFGISDIIAPVQETTIASKTHLPNEKFYYKGKLYKVNSVIFANGLITPGVNCEQITLAEAMPVSIIEGQGTNSLVLNDLIKTNATGVKSVAEGTSRAKAGYSHAEGQESEASGGASHAEGWYSKAKGSHSHAEGGLDDTRGKIKITGAANTTTYTYTVVDNDFVENFGNHALYYKNSVYYISAIDVEGKTVTVTETLSASTALSNVQVSWGTYSYAEGINSHAENSGYAYAQGSHAEGVSVSAELYSHAEGKSYTIGECSHAENNSIAAGNYSHAQGYGSTLGAYAHAQGYNTSAEGANSHVEGQHTTASRKNQHVFGKYNIKDEPANTTSNDLGTYVEIVGNGTSTSATSNARTLDWNGNEVLAGSLTIGGSEVLNKTTLQQLKKMPVNIVDGNGTNSIVLGNTSKAKATGTRAIAEATGTATGNNSHAEGWSTEAKATAAHSEGYFSRAVGAYSHAEGGYYSTFGEMRVTGAANATTYTYNGTFAELEDGPNYLIIYNNTIYTVSSVDVTHKTITLTTTLNKSAAVSNLSVDLATTPYAYGSRSHAEGSAYASGQLSHAQGTGARAAGFGSHAEGKLTKASGLYSHAEGFQTLANQQDAHAEGYMTVAAGLHSHAEGSQSATDEYGAHAEGCGTYASGRGSHAEGNQTMATGAAAHSEGYSTEAAGVYAHSEGNRTTATGQDAHAEGLRTIAKGSNSHAEGGTSSKIGTIYITGAANATTFTYSDDHTTSKFYKNYPNSYITYQSLWYQITNIDTTRKQITLKMPLSSSAINDLEVDWGTYSYANQECSHSEGSSCAYDEYAHAEGVGTVAAGWTSHSEGYRALASGDWSHAQGYETIASYNCAHAEGQCTEASNSGSHAEGDSTKASGSYSHAEGSYTIASADYAHAEGAETQASGESSHSEGNSTVANHASQHVFGEYNIVDTSSASADSRGTYVEIVGNGNDVTRSNARTLDWNGNETLAGNLTLGDHTLMPQAVPSVIFGTQTGTTAAWTGTAPFSTLIDGTVILYWLPQTSASNATLNLTLANGLTTGAKNIYIDGTTRCGTQIASGNLILMMYRNKPTIGSVTNLQGWWIVKS